MKSLIIFLVLLSVALASADERVDDIYAAYVAGDLIKAGELYRKMPPSPTRDGNRLFITALLEPDARKASELLKTAVKSNLDGKYIEEAYFKLIQLAEAGGDTAEVSERGAEFLRNRENSRFREALLALMAAHQKPESGEEKRYLDLLISESPGSFYGQGARLVKAYYAFNRGHYRTAETECRKINNAPGDDLVPASLIMLSRVGLKEDQTERALLNYNILREQYHHALGQEELLTALKSVSEKQSGEESEEIFEGVTYSVQIGVFAYKDNAVNMEKRAEAYGYKSRIKDKRISGKKYYVVLAGKFKTLSEAQIAKEKLELGENEVFKVILNDEK